MFRLQFATMALMLSTAVIAAELQNFADASAEDPLASLKQQIGVSRDDFKLAFPEKKGVAFDMNCKFQIHPAVKNGKIERIKLTNYPATEQCRNLAVETLTKSYGKPARDSYGYGISTGTSIGHISFATFTWCLRDYDIIIYGNTTTLMRPGDRHPGSAKKVEPGSRDHKARCSSSD